MQGLVDHYIVWLVSDQLLYRGLAKLLYTNLFGVRGAIIWDRHYQSEKKRTHRLEALLTDTAQSASSGHLPDVIAHRRWRGLRTDDGQEVGD